MAGSELKVVIGVPSNGLWVEQFGISMCKLLVAFYGLRPGPQYKTWSVNVHSERGSLLSKQRWRIVQKTLEQKADYLLFLDSDHSFPANLLHRLLARGKPVVAVNFATKCIPSFPTARNKPTEDHPEGAPVYSRPNSPPLEQVWRVGTGCVLIHRSVLEKIGSKIFEVTFREDVQDYSGEDWPMFEAIEAAGYDVWVDHELSLECGHWGWHNYTHDGVMDRDEFNAFAKQFEELYNGGKEAGDENGVGVDGQSVDGPGGSREVQAEEPHVHELVR